MPHYLYVGTLTDLLGCFPSKGAVEGGFFLFSLFDDCLHGWLLSRLFIISAVVARRLVRFFPPFFFVCFFGISDLSLTNVLSSGLPLPAPGLSGSLFVSGLWGLCSGCSAQWGLGAVFLWLSIQPLPWIGCFLRLGWRRLFESAVVFYWSNDGIPILHGKINRFDWKQVFL